MRRGGTGLEGKAACLLCACSPAEARAGTGQLEGWGVRHPLGTRRKQVLVDFQGASTSSSKAPQILFFLGFLGGPPSSSPEKPLAMGTALRAARGLPRFPWHEPSCQEKPNPASPLLPSKTVKLPNESQALCPAGRSGYQVPAALQTGLAPSIMPTAPSHCLDLGPHPFSPEE